MISWKTMAMSAKNSVLIFLLCFTIPTLPLGTADGGEGFSVSGEIRFPESGYLFVQIVTREQFSGSGKKGEEKARPIGMVIPVGPAEQKAKKAPFTFTNVPAGTYGIRVFQDVNGNKDLDAGLFGPTEPWGMHRSKRPAFRGPTFEEIAFDVHEDVVDVVIVLE